VRSRWRGAWVALATVLSLAGFVAADALIAFGASSTERAEKVWVCKYVGTPGVDERLQTGQNPISVSASSLEGNGFAGTFPFEFSDAHGRSVAIGYDTGGAEPSCGSD
jgi:hypothetical protein